MIRQIQPRRRLRNNPLSQGPLPQQKFRRSRSASGSPGKFCCLPEENLRPEWRALGYFVTVALTTYWVMWLGVSLFPEPVRGPALLWREMYQEFAMLVGAICRRS